MQKRSISNQEIQNQIVYRTDFWSLLLPERPVSPYHLLLLVNRDNVTQFIELSDDELINMKTVVSSIVEKIEINDIKLIGYNLFSNNGAYEIGQHLNRFHQHIFVRTENETESPYALMADGRRWAKIGSDEWNSKLEELRELFNS